MSRLGNGPREPLTNLRHCPRLDTMTTDHLTTAEVAATLGVDVRTVHRWVTAGELTPLTKLPGLRGAYLFARSDVEALVRAS